MDMGRAAAVLLLVVLVGPCAVASEQPFTAATASEISNDTCKQIASGQCLSARGLLAQKLAR